MSVSALGLPQCLARRPRSVQCLDEFLMPAISEENSLSFSRRISDTKPVTSRAEWPSFPRTKTETGTEMSVPVSIHITVTSLTVSLVGSSPLQGLPGERPFRLRFGNKATAVEVYDLIVSNNKDIRDL